MTGNAGGRPGPTPGGVTLAPRDMTSVAPTTDTLPEVEQRAGGVVRYTSARTVEAVCTACFRQFRSTGTAASHTRATRHAVHVRYGSVFTFVPAEHLEQALRDVGGAA